MLTSAVGIITSERGSVPIKYPARIKSVGNWDMMSFNDLSSIVLLGERYMEVRVIVLCNEILTATACQGVFNCIGLCGSMLLIIIETLPWDLSPSL